jgi:hypothetical protein
VLEDCIIILRRIRDFNSYTVISTVAYRKISSEIAIKKIRNQQE